MKLAVSFLFTTVLLAAPACSVASASLSVSPTAYNFASFDDAGNPIPNDINSTGVDGVNNGADNGYDVGYWTASTSFNLTSTDAILDVSNFRADDRAVLELNGTVVAAVGGYMSAIGQFIFTPTGSEVSQNFDPQSTTYDITSGFVAGQNTLEILVNNTGNGIYGGLEGGPTGIVFTATLSAPEPQVWVLLFVGSGATGATLRFRNKARHRLFI